MEFHQFPHVVVGAGLWGITISERISRELKSPVLLLDTRKILGGNSTSIEDRETGIEYHPYGAHIFHTKSKKVWDYLLRFTEFNTYRHKVLSKYQNKIYSFPINLSTVNSFFNLNLTSQSLPGFLDKERASEFYHNPKNLEEKAVSLIGRKLYEAFVKGYTQKQWEISPLKLPESIISRIPVRLDDNPYYFSDTYEGIPKIGYMGLFQKMSQNPLIHISLNIDYFKIRHLLNPQAKIYYSGALDRYFDYRLGELKWRTLNFETERYDKHSFQENSVINYADPQIPFTRIHEFKYFHQERKELFKQKKTLIMKEYSHKFNKDTSTYGPMYPINDEANQNLQTSYLKLANKEANLTIGGRLGTYAYLDMDKVILEALNLDLKNNKEMSYLHTKDRYEEYSRPHHASL